MRNTKIIWVLILSLITISASAQRKKNRSSIFKRNVTVGNTDRVYGVALPNNYDEEKKYSTVYLFHGGGGNMRDFSKRSGWIKAAKKNDIILVMLQAQERCLDRDGSKQTKNYWLTKEKESLLCDASGSVSDLDYLDAVIMQVEGSYEADSNRRYACGFSNGLGFIMQNILTERPNTFAAVGGSSSLIHKSLETTGMTPLYLMLGNLDDRFLTHSNKEYYKLDKDAITSDPIQGQAIKFITGYMKICTEPISVKEDGSIQLIYKNDHTQFVYQLLENVGHKFPSGNIKSNGFYGAQILLDFFLQFNNE